MIQIYHNNFYLTLTKALRGIYPTIHQLVGEEFFNQCAHFYIQKNPSQSRDLQTYGGNLAVFLAEYSPAKTLPYLSEVAQFDWATHQVYYAADSKPFDINKLTQVSEKHYQDLKFKLHRASKILSFRYPILQIWQLCQQKKKSSEIIDLAQGGLNLLVIRRHLDIEFVTLSMGEYALLSAFAENKTFREACSKALQVEPEFNVADCFNHHMKHHTIIDVAIRD